MKMLLSFILFFLTSISCHAMRKGDLDKDHRKTASAGGTPPPRASLPIIAQAMAESKKSSSADNSPVRNSGPGTLKDSKRASNLSTSPAGSRLARTIGKRGSLDIFDLQQQLAELEREKSADVTEQQLKERYDKAKSESPALRQKALEQIVALRTRNESPTKALAAQEILKACLHEVATSLRNFHKYKKEKMDQEARGQFSFLFQQYYMARRALIEKYQAEEPTKPHHMCEYNADRELGPIKKKAEEFLNQDWTKLEYMDFEEHLKLIKEENFLPS